MPQYTLHYFNLRGRGQLIRLLFIQAGVEFTDHRFEFKEWGEVEKKNTVRYPFGTAPTLEVDGRILPESVAIARYVAEETGLSGKNNWDKALCEIYVEKLQDLGRDCLPLTSFRSKGKDEAEVEKERKELYEGKFSKKLAVLENLFKSNNEGKGYLVGETLTWADLAFIDAADMFINIYPNCLDDAPLLKGLNSRILALPKIKDFMDARSPYII